MNSYWGNEAVSINNPWSNTRATGIFQTTIDKIYFTNEADVPADTFTINQKFRIHINISCYPGTAGPTTVYIYFGKDTYHMKQVRIKTAPAFVGTWDVWTTFTGEELGVTQSGKYVFGVRLGSENKAHVASVNFTVPPPPNKAQINITSTPSGVSMYIDGHSVGITPVNVQVDAGTHSITFKVPNGYYFGGCSGANKGTNACIVNVKSGDIVDVNINFYKKKVPFWESTWKWGLVGLGIGVLAFFLMPKTGAKVQEIIVPYAQKAIQKTKQVVPTYAKKLKSAITKVI